MIIRVFKKKICSLFNVLLIIEAVCASTFRPAKPSWAQTITVELKALRFLTPTAHICSNYWFNLNLDVFYYFFNFWLRPIEVQLKFVWRFLFFSLSFTFIFPFFSCIHSFSIFRVFNISPFRFSQMLMKSLLLIFKKNGENLLIWSLQLLKRVKRLKLKSEDVFGRLIVSIIRVENFLIVLLLPWEVLRKFMLPMLFPEFVASWIGWAVMMMPSSIPVVFSITGRLIIFERWRNLRVHMVIIKEVLLILVERNLILRVKEVHWSFLILLLIERCRILKVSFHFNIFNVLPYRWMRRLKNCSVSRRILLFLKIMKLFECYWSHAVHFRILRGQTKLLRIKADLFKIHWLVKHFSCLVRKGKSLDWRDKCIFRLRVSRTYLIFRKVYCSLKLCK